MSIQVGKAAIFTKESLIKIQDQMRQKWIKSFNKVYGFNYNLKEKELGRNKDINVKDMINYSNVKKDIQKSKNKLDKLNNNANNIKEKSVEIAKTLSELKTLPLNKSNYSISKTDADKLKKYIEETKESSNHMLNTNNIANIMTEYEKDLKEHKKEVKELNSIINNQQKDYDNLDFHYSMLVNENNNLKKENNYLSKIIYKLNSTIERISNFVYKLFYKGYIQKKIWLKSKKKELCLEKIKIQKKMILSYNSNHLLIYLRYIYFYL